MVEFHGQAKNEVCVAQSSSPLGSLPHDHADMLMATVAGPMRGRSVG
jgi:hypothetical protein